MTLEDLLSNYKISRSDMQGEICLKMGGTLRYRYEICYVVIVCMEGDNVGGMPAITTEGMPQFDPNGLVDDKGIVVNIKAIPDFSIQSIVKKNNKENYDWEQLVFGLYFPAHMLRCAVVSEQEVAHEPSGPTCTAKARPVMQGRGVNWACPNRNRNLN